MNEPRVAYRDAHCRSAADASHLNLLIEKSPESVSPWIPPRELARLLGVSSQTITAYRNDGRFRSSSTRAIKRGQRTDWEYHRQDAIADVRGLV